MKLKTKTNLSIISMAIMAIYIIILVMTSVKNLTEGQMMGILFVILIMGFLNFLSHGHLTRWIIMTILITLIILI